MRPVHVDKAERWFMRYQGKAVLICRCIPLVRSLISVPAGFAKMGIPRFLILTGIGSTVWNTVLVCIGAALGVAWENAMPYFDKYTHLAIIIGAVLVISVGTLYLIRKKRKSNDCNTQQNISKQ